MAVQRRPAATAAEINFGDLAFYMAGGGMPDGDYILVDLTVKMHTPTDRKTNMPVGAPRLAVAVTFQPMGDLSVEAQRTIPYSMGTKAHESFMPNPDTGKGVVAIPGGKSSNAYEGSNWHYFLKSLYDSGLPAGIFTNNTAVLEGTHVHMHSIDEPEERKNFKQSSTAEVQQEARQPSKIAVVTEIKDDGKPWEGSGGVPEGVVIPGTVAEAEPVAAAPAKVNGKPASVKATPAPAPAETTDGDVVDQAGDVLTDVLSMPQYANGLPRLALRTEAFKIAEKKYNKGVAQAIATNVFDNASMFSKVLGDIGYLVKGPQVIPAT